MSVNVDEYASKSLGAYYKTHRLVFIKAQVELQEQIKFKVL